MKKSTAKKSAGTKTVSPEKQLAGFIAKFDAANARLIRECRVELRKLLPTATEIVYDNYNFFVIGYSPTLRPSDTICALAAAANGVGLSFYHGADLPDPEKLLLGSGKQNRFIRLPEVAVLRKNGVRKLIAAAIALGPPLPEAGEGQTIIKSVSAKQRPRRKK